nr:reverse transcriptase domain-containing protein [Tanacetum cinerariifolium]
MATEGNGDLPVSDLRTMKELCQPTLNGRGGPIAPIGIQATNFGLKNDMIQQVYNSCQFHGLSGDDANNHLDKFLHVTHSIKVNGVTDDALHLYLFPRFLTHLAGSQPMLQSSKENTHKALVFTLEIAPLFLGFESGDKDDRLCLPKMPSITIHSIFAYGTLKSLTNQSLKCVLNAFDFPPIRVAFSLQDKDARRVIGVIRLTRRGLSSWREKRCK